MFWIYLKGWKPPVSAQPVKGWFSFSKKALVSWCRIRVLNICRKMKDDSEVEFENDTKTYGRNITSNHQTTYESSFIIIKTSGSFFETTGISLPGVKTYGLEYKAKKWTSCWIRAFYQLNKGKAQFLAWKLANDVQLQIRYSAALFFE